MPPRARSDQWVSKPQRDLPAQVALVSDASKHILPVPKLIVANPNAYVLNFWASLKSSPMRCYWQDTDWAAAQMAAYLLQDITTPRAGKGPGAQLVAEVNRIFDTLGMTEIQRRKGGIEIERRIDTSAEDAEIEAAYEAEMMG